MTNRRTACNEVALGLVYTAVLYASFVHDVFRIAGPLHDCVIGYDSHHVLDRLDSGAQQSHADLFVFSSVAACGLALALCAGMAAFFVAAGRWLGSLSGHLGVGLLSCSMIWMNFAPSLYWASFLLLLPFELAWLFEPACSKSRGRFALLLAGIGIAVMTKCLCGYEYVTAVILSPIAALVFHRVRTQNFGWRTLWPMTGMIAAGVLGFAGALVVHSAQIRAITGSSGWSAIAERARVRTIEIGDPAGENHVELPAFGPLRYLDSQSAYAVRAFCRYFAMPPIALPMGLTARKFIPLYWFVALTGVLLASLRRRVILSTDGQALTLSLTAALIASLSWQILAVNHMAVHFHLNMVVFQLPFLPLAFLTVGWLVQQAARAVRAEHVVGIGVGSLGLVLAMANVISTTCRAAAERAIDLSARETVVGRLAAGPAVNDLPALECRIVSRPVGEWGFELMHSALVRRHSPVDEYCEIRGSVERDARVVVVGPNGPSAVYRFVVEPQAPTEAVARIPASAIRTRESLRAYLVDGLRQSSLCEIHWPPELIASHPR